MNLLWYPTTIPNSLIRNLGVSKNRGIWPPKWMVEIMVPKPNKCHGFGGKKPLPTPLFLVKHPSLFLYSNTFFFFRESIGAVRCLSERPRRPRHWDTSRGPRPSPFQSDHVPSCRFPNAPHSGKRHAFSKKSRTYRDEHVEIVGTREVYRNMVGIGISFLTCSYNDLSTL